MSEDAIGQIWFVVYLVLGIPVAYYHMRQQNMESSAEQAGSRPHGMIVFTLACLWPLLLLSMGLNYLNAKNKPRKTVASKPAKPSDAPIEHPERRIDPSELDRL